jgi:hypothetical protein
MKGITYYSLTTRIGCFAKCLKHSAKPEKHSTKSLPSVALSKKGSTNSTSAKASLMSTFLGHSVQTLPSARWYSAKKSGRHGAGVTEVASLPSVLGDTRQRSYLFAECLPASTRQRIRQRVPLSGSLPSALYGTRQSVPLCQVPGPTHSAKNLYWCPGIGSLLSVMALTLGKVTSTHIF